MKKESIGTTAFGREIPLFRSEREDAAVLLVGGIHAREWITCDLLETLTASEKVTIDHVPCLNPDGVALAKYGLSSVERKEDRDRLVRLNGGEDFSLWKSNGMGVDINVNFDADWGEGKKNLTTAGRENYIGVSPESERETQAVCALIRRRRYSLVVCYHCLGEEVYWGYDWNFRHYEEAKRYADFLGYELTRSEGSCGGLKDWYCTHFAGLGLTVEVGKDDWGHPCPQEKLKELSATHRGSLALLEETGGQLARKIHGGSH